MSELGEAGARRIEWAREHMPVLAAIREELKTKNTLRGLRIGMALHVEAKTGVLALSLREAGATVRLASCNPLSTDDSVAKELAETYGLEVYAKKWQANEEYYANLHKVLDLNAELVIHDGGGLDGPIGGSLLAPPRTVGGIPPPRDRLEVHGDGSALRRAAVRPAPRERGARAQRDRDGRSRENRER